MKDKILRIIILIIAAVALLQMIPSKVSAQQTAPVITVSDAQGAVGQQVDVTVSIQNNPGIVSMMLEVMYDPAYLKLVAVADSGLLPGAMHKDNGQISDRTQTPPYTLSWANDSVSENYMVEGVLVTLTFEILASARVGAAYEVSVSYDLEEYDIYDCTLKPVSFETESGWVKVVASEQTPAIVVSEVTGTTGKNVEVTIALRNNPGLVSMTLQVSYDARYLRLVSAADSGLLPGKAHEDNGSIQPGTQTPPYTLAWANDESRTNYTVDGVLVTLTFEILAAAKTGEQYAVTVSYQSDNYDIYDCDLKPVDFVVENGGILVACGHNYTAVVTDPTCTQQGYTTHTCTLCQDIYVDTYVDAHGHSFTNYVSDGNATVEADGTKTAHCDYGCGQTHTITDEGSRLVSSITSDVYTVLDGYISKIPVGTSVEDLLDGIHQDNVIAVNNGNSVNVDAKAATGMVVQLIVNGEVVDAVTVIVSGDTNGDGGITITDMLAVKSHILKKTTLTGAAFMAADTSGDNAVSVTDFIQIKSHILGKGTVTPHSTKTPIARECAGGAAVASRAVFLM